MVVLLPSEVSMNMNQWSFTMTEPWRQFLSSQERIEGKWTAKKGGRSEERLRPLLNNRVSSSFHGLSIFQFGLGLPMAYLHQGALWRKQVDGG